MNTRWFLVASFFTATMISACSSHRPFDPALENREVYVCCNLRFNSHGDATDANYAYSTGGGTTIPFGTRVRVTKVRAWSVEIQPERNRNTYRLEFRFGRRAMSANQYFHNILRDTDPKGTLASASPRVVEAISQGRLIVGMTKEEALMARGYPPCHRTASIGANEWVYYHSMGYVDRLQFVEGKIESIKLGPAPE
jgi:hypothetical protein